MRLDLDVLLSQKQDGAHPEITERDIHDRESAIGFDRPTGVP